MRQRAGTDRANARANGGRECAEDIHGRRKPLGESLVAALRLVEFAGFPLKYGEDGFRRVTGPYLRRERVSDKVLSGLLLVLYQSFFEDGLKIRNGRGHLEIGRHRVYCECGLDKRIGRKSGGRRPFLGSGCAHVPCLVYVANHRFSSNETPGTHDLIDRDRTAGTVTQPFSADLAEIQNAYGYLDGYCTQ